MPETVRLDSAEGVAEIALSHPPVNALSLALRGPLLAAVERAAADPEVRVLVIRAEGRTWPAGADIAEFAAPFAEPTPGEVCDRIEACGKPVIAALHGTVLGGGLELALAAACRIAAPDARFGFPEFGLCLLPGAGGTQRAPRLIGAAEALRLMLTARPVDAAEALALGLIDEVAEDPAAAARALARRAAAEGPKALPPRDPGRWTRAPGAWLDAVAAARKALPAPHPPLPAAVLAPVAARIAGCVEAALLLPPAEGMDYERAAFEDCRAAPEAAGLAHAFRAERRAARLPAPAAPLRPLARAGLTGGGPAATGIALALLQSGLAVTLVEPDAESLRRALERIATAQERAVRAGQRSGEDRDADWDRLSGATGFAALAEADIGIEALAEDGDRAAALAALDRALPEGAVIATIAAHAGLEALAAATARPGAVLGLHFYAPAEAVRLMELAATPATAPETLAAGMALAKRLGKVAVRAAPGAGPLGARLLDALRVAADALMGQGASPAAIDAGLRGYGFAPGPCEGLDLAGIDLALARRRPGAAPPLAFAARLAAAGRTGRRAGRGFYLWPEGARRGEEDPEALALIEAERRALNLVMRGLTGEDIRRLCLAALVNEGARLLEEGAALRPSDLDVVMTLGLGFPRWRGGPMHAADREGLLQLRNELRRGGAEDDPWWRPAGLWDRLIREGRHFADLDGE